MLLLVRFYLTLSIGNEKVIVMTFLGKVGKRIISLNFHINFYEVNYQLIRIIGVSK